jgi:hypothetical protein
MSMAFFYHRVINLTAQIELYGKESKTWASDFNQVMHCLSAGLITMSHLCRTGDSILIIPRGPRQLMRRFTVFDAEDPFSIKRWQLFDHLPADQQTSILRELLDFRERYNEVHGDRKLMNIVK